MSKSREYAAAFALVAFFVAAAVSSAVRQSATVDEFAHLPAALYALKTGDFSLYNKTPPLGRALVSLPALAASPRVKDNLQGYNPGSWRPWRYGHDFLMTNRDGYGSILFAGRMGAIMAGVLVCLLTWLASRRLFGQGGGLVSLAACAMSPTLIAHSSLVTADAPAALFSLLFIMALAHYLSRPGLARAALVGIALSAAILSKFTCLFWVPFAAAAPIVAFFRSADTEEFAKRRPAILAQVPVICLVPWLAAWIVYSAEGHVEAWKGPVGSTLLKPAESALNLGLLPREFVSGLDAQLYDAQTGEWREGNYLLGRWYSGHKWYYFPLAVLVKEPVPILLVFASALWFLSWGGGGLETMLYPAAAVCWFVFACFFGGLQIGIRYILPVYPLAFVAMGIVGKAAFEVGARQKKSFPLAWKKGALLALGLWLLAGDALVWPNYLSYFNIFSGGSGRGYKILLDSNYDWGQGLPALKGWMEKEKIESIELAYFGHDDPARFKINYSLPGESGGDYVAISANLLMGQKYPMTFAPERVGKDDPVWKVIEDYRDQEPVKTLGGILVFKKAS